MTKADMTKADMTKTDVPVLYWSEAGKFHDDECLGRQMKQVEGHCSEDSFADGFLPFSQEGRFQRGKLKVPSNGTLVVEYVSPRPLRIWFGEVLVVDECLYRYSFQREVRGAFLFPCHSEEITFTVETGPRPTHLPFVDEHCPSRNREKVMTALQRQFPDRLELRAHLVSDVAGPVVSLRFPPTQYAEDGVVYQHILAREADGSVMEMPSVDSWSTADYPYEPLTLATKSGVPLRGKASDAERRKGLQRFFMPIGRVDNPPFPLRTAESDLRVEPRLEQVDTLPFRIVGKGGDITVDMPVYEQLGRNAPSREYEAMQWPTYEDAKGKLPTPILPDGMQHFGALYDEAWAMLFRLVRHPEKESGITQPYIATGTNFTHSQFVWDTSFTAMCTAYACRAMPIETSMNLLYGGQADGGYIHRERDTRDGMPILYEPDFSPNPPLLSVAEWAMASVTGDKERLRKVYPLLVGYHHWLEANRRLPDGTYWTTGLANGLDNSPSLGDGYPCLTAQMAHDAEMLGKIAETIGEEADAKHWREQMTEIGTALNGNLWDDGIGFYSTSLPGGGFNPNKVVTGFWPLWAGVVPPDRVDKLAGHLKDPKSFWRHHPVPSLAADSPHFVPGGQYWLGSSWAPTNFAVIKGFDRAGRHDLAVETTLRQLQCMWEVYQETGFIWENYSTETSRNGSWSMKDYCWSALGPIALLIEVVLGIRVDAMRETVRWSPPEKQRCGVEDLPVGQATVSLLQEESDGKWQVAVRTDKPIWVEVNTGKYDKRVRCNTGMSHVDLPG